MKQSPTRFAYFTLLLLALCTHVAEAQTLTYAASVVDFSSQFSSSSYSAEQATGEPDTYPSYGDLPTAWASATADGQREQLTLGFAPRADVTHVGIYETLNPGAVDELLVRYVGTSDFERVWQGTAAATGTAESRIFQVAVDLGGRAIDALRIRSNSPAVPGWNEIDAVALSDGPIAGGTGGSNEPPQAVFEVTGARTVQDGFRVKITWSANVTGFTADDVALSGAAASVTRFDESNGVYFVLVKPSAAGTVRLSVAAGAATNANGIESEAASVDVEVDYAGELYGSWYLYDRSPQNARGYDLVDLGDSIALVASRAAADGGDRLVHADMIGDTMLRGRLLRDAAGEFLRTRGLPQAAALPGGQLAVLVDGTLYRYGSGLRPLENLGTVPGSGGDLASTSDGTLYLWNGAQLHRRARGNWEELTVPATGIGGRDAEIHVRSDGDLALFAANDNATVAYTVTLANGVVTATPTLPTASSDEVDFAVGPDGAYYVLDGRPNTGVEAYRLDPGATDWTLIAEAGTFDRASSDPTASQIEVSADGSVFVIAHGVQGKLFRYDGTEWDGGDQQPNVTFADRGTNLELKFIGGYLYSVSNFLRSFGVTSTLLRMRVEDGTVGVRTVAEVPSVRAFPNPTRGVLRIALPPTAQRYEVVDVTGARVLADRMAAGAEEVSLSLKRLPPGFYAVVLKDARGRLVGRARVLRQ